MSIAALQRVTLIGRTADRAALLGGLQALGCVHVTPMLRESRRAAATFEADVAPEGGSAIANAWKALNFLTDAPWRRHQLAADPAFDLDAMVDTVLELRTRLRVATDRRDFLQARIADVEPWGEITYHSDEAPGGWHLWFYELPLRQRRQLQTLDLPWSIVASDNRIAYVVVLSRQEPPPDLLPVPRVHLGSAPLSELRAELRRTEIEIDDLVAERVALTRYIYLLTSNLYQAENEAALRTAARATWQDQALVALQGWAPVDRLDDLQQFAAAGGLAFVSEPPGPDDDPPTLLVQPAARRAGVDLALFYQVPGYRSWDPSLLILVSFPLFFAMIMSDAGYGLVMAGGLVAYWRRLGRSSTGRSWRRLGLTLTAATVLYGVLVGSYFGAAPPADGLLASLHVLEIDDFDAMMKLSIGVGVVHVIIANLMSALARRHAPDAPSRLGWIALCLGAYALYLAGASPPARALAIPLIAGGLLLVLLYSSARRARSPADQLRRLADGATALARLMTAFGDILSYMRLFALGLASASLAVTFNDLAHDARVALPGLGLLSAGLILALGHGLNFVLAIISGVVHGLRLHYIEFFNWGFDTEGEAFRPFARKEMGLHE